MKKELTMEEKVARGKRLKVLKENAFVWVIIAFPMVCFLLFYVYVNINSFVMAFQTTDITGKDTWVGIYNFTRFFKEMTQGEKYLGVAVVNSFKIYFINLLICMPLYILFSYILFKKMPGHTVMRAMVMIPNVVSGMIIALVFKKFVDNALPEIMSQVFGVTDFPFLLSDAGTAFGTTIFYQIWVSFGLSLLSYSNAMGEIDEEIIHSAHIDGINSMILELRYIILPLIYPTLETFLIVGFTTILTNEGPLITFWGSGAPVETWTFGYFYSKSIMTNDVGKYNMLAAGGLLVSLIIVPATQFLKKFLDKFLPEV